MDTYVAGWDGGGTKTRVVCLSAGGEPFAEHTFGPLNPNGTSETEVCRTVSEALRWMETLGRCTALTVSSAGVSNPDVSSLLGRLLSENGYHERFQLVGDQESALYGAVGPYGAVLVAGTGSICYGRNRQGDTARSGGYGYLVDDEGSGYAIGRDILTAVLRAGDGR
ncbi:MAG TPA: BadF/BadG/BcrA/BcrD ATPase family protein, partial [Candidatus Limiplasma sp.]|nr:BadF/BadG/BcrA/BcrD ATPase family protein [Candidatus Limiplasma sp.]